MCWIDIIERFKQLPIAEQEIIARALKERYATRVVPVEVVDREYELECGIQALNAPGCGSRSQS